MTEPRLNDADEPSARKTTAPRIGAIFGMGRSGTTWLGSLIDTHPDVAYRFEPFGRLRRRPAIQEVRRRIDAGEFSEADLPRIYDQLIRANPMTDKPPHFTKAHAATFGRRLFRPIATKLGPLHWLYEAAYRPTGQPYLIFKEVTAAKLLNAFVSKTRIPILYLVRHPCGNVASRMKGQAEGKMPTGKFPVLDELVARHDPALADRLGTGLEHRDPAFKNAVLWRIEVEASMRAMAGVPTCRLLIYENLCREPEALASAAFQHLGLEPTAELSRFLRRSTSGSGAKSSGYFSVIKNPIESMEKWKNHLTKTQINTILEIVSESPEFAKLAADGRW